MKKRIISSVLSLIIMLEVFVQLGNVALAHSENESMVSNINNCELLSENEVETSVESLDEPAIAISSKEDLDNIRYNLGGNYYLTNDIQFEDEDFDEGGLFYNDNTGWIPIGTPEAPFHGNLDGKGHTIAGLKIQLRETNNNYVGLFGFIAGGDETCHISNLILSECDISASFSANKAIYAGAFAGSAENCCIEYCSHSGKISAKGVSYVGGIVGCLYNNGVINCCCNMGNIVANSCYTSAGNSDYYSTCYAGGIVGSNSGNIANSFSYGDISASGNSGSYQSGIGAGYAGRIVGYSNNGAISTSYSVGSCLSIKSGYATDAGLVGLVFSTHNMNSYYAPGSKTYDDMKNKDTFAGFDFDTIWTMDGNKDYPFPEIIGLDVDFELGLESRQLNVPNKTNYLQYEEIDLEGGSIEYIYNEGTREEISLTKNMISGFDSAIIGQQIVTVTYEETEYSFYVNISKYLAGICIESLPSKLLYCMGIDTDLNLDGGKLSLRYSDGTIDTIDINPDMISEFDLTKSGQQLLTITYGGFTETFFIEVLEEDTINFLGGNGTAESPFLISNKDHLNNVRKYPNACFLMLANISFSEADFSENGSFYNNGAGWTPIGNNDKPFTGYFDGGNKIVKGLYVNASYTDSASTGLFGTTNGATIKNLNLTEGSISLEISKQPHYSDYDVYGCLGAFIGEANSTTIENCSSNAVLLLDVTLLPYSRQLHAYSYCGGIIGKANNTNILGCSCDGTVKVINQNGRAYSSGTSAYAYGYVGGIVGEQSGNGSIINCKNNSLCDAELTATTDSYTNNTARVYSYIGGISGSASGIISGCINNGNLMSVLYSDAGMGDEGNIDHKGGICGYSAAEISDCHNSGTIYTQAKDTFDVGGIVGCDYNGSVNKSCNNGNIIVLGNWIDGYSSLGGIVGVSYTSCCDCYNTGLISNEATHVGTNGEAAFGSVIGELVSTYDIVSNCNIASVIVKNCYSAMPPESSLMIGNVFGKGTPAVAENLYYFEDQCNGNSPDKDFTICISENGRNKAISYVGFDFDNVWEISDTTDYPYPLLKKNSIQWEYTGLTLESGPEKVKYLVNKEILDVTGIVIRINRNGHKTNEILHVTNDMLSGFDNTVLGEQTVVVTYDGYEVAFVIEIVAENTSDFNGGIGTESYPYLISNEEQLMKINKDLDACYRLTSDIVINGNYIPIGYTLQTGGGYLHGYVISYIDPFRGTFDGNGHRIEYSTTLLSHDFDDRQFFGLFANNEGAIINLGIKCDISLSGISSFFVGAIAGTNSGIIENCFSFSDISAIAISRIGGRDYVANATFSDYYADCNVGGICGSSSGIVKNSYHVGNIYSEAQAVYVTNKTNYGDASAGGICGGYGSAVNCYNVGSVEAVAYETYGRPTKHFYPCAYEAQCCYAVDCDSILYQSDCVGFDFDNVWGIDPFTGYDNPQLKWQLNEITNVELSDSVDSPITFTEGTIPDISNIYVKATYKNGELAEMPITMAFLEGLDINRVGDQTVTITLGQYIIGTVSFAVNEKKALSISLLSQPAKLSYVQGQPINGFGGKLLVEYNNDTSDEIPLSEAEMAYDINAVGETSVMVTYQNLTTYFDINVIPKEVKSIVLIQPSKLNYIVGEPLDFSDGYIRVYYVSDDGYYEELPIRSEMISGYDINSAGIQSLIVAYQEWSESFVVRTSFATVVFKNWNNDILSTAQYKYGDEIIAPNNPTRDKDVNGQYHFVGWDKNIEKCTESTVYTAQYELEIIIYGDLNDDGLVNKKDSLLMKMYLADNTTVINQDAADVFADGAINKRDSLLLKQFLAGLDVVLGA